MKQIPFPPPTATGPVVMAYGGGVNTMAALIEATRRGVKFTAIVMADPGHEWPQTHWYRDNIANPWLIEHGQPTVTVVTRAAEAKFRPRAGLIYQGTLGEECLRIKALPSIAYGWKKCSQKYKAAPSNWWIERQPWAQEAWSRGERITRIIGYDADEPSRARPEFLDAREASRFVPRYILLERGIDRDGCIAIIERAGLPVPHKSACMWCPSNQLAEWREVRDHHPDVYSYALGMEANAEIGSPDVVGLVRVMPNGRRQLRMLDEGAPVMEREGEVPCDCAL